MPTVVQVKSGAGRGTTATHSGSPLQEHSKETAQAGAGGVVELA